ncbi:hypothetical protein ACHAWF_016383 [Thalassiosira exigua]
MRRLSQEVSWCIIPSRVTMRLCLCSKPVRAARRHRNPGFKIAPGTSRRHRRCGQVHLRVRSRVPLDGGVLRAPRAGQSGHGLPPMLPRDGRGRDALPAREGRRPAVLRRVLRRTSRRPGGRTAVRRARGDIGAVSVRELGLGLVQRGGGRRSRTGRAGRVGVEAASVAVGRGVVGVGHEQDPADHGVVHTGVRLEPEGWILRRGSERHAEGQRVRLREELRGRLDA